MATTMFYRWLYTLMVVPKLKCLKMVDSKPVDDQSWRIIALFKTVEATYEEMMGGSEVLQSTENSSIFNLIDGRLFFAQCPRLN